MTLHRINPEDIEQFTLVTRPTKTFISSSSGLTGSIPLFARQSSYIKEVQDLSPFMVTTKREDGSTSVIRFPSFPRNPDGSLVNPNISGFMKVYLSEVNLRPPSARQEKELQVIRFEPSFRFTKDTQRKNVIQNVLNPFYRTEYPSAHWAYTNYHTLNFFTASSVPSNSVLLYPSSASAESSLTISGAYALGDAFTFEFYINPRYTTDRPGDDFKAGTLFHLSSSYAVSLVSGTSIDRVGRPDGFRLLLQLSGGADVAPSLCKDDTALAFFSNDNSLTRNRWHHVAIRWGANNDNRTGSFIIDGNKAGTFVFPSATIAPAPFKTSGNPDVLSVGNFYEGNNIGANAQAIFFNQNISAREGLVQLVDTGLASSNTPGVFTYNHPLNAEVHELKIWPEFRSNAALAKSAATGSSQIGGLIFYVPPFFVKESPYRMAAVQGGVLQTPFQSIAGSTEDPFNVAMSFGVGGRYINLENFTRDFATGFYPRLLHLSASEITTTLNQAYSANDLLYDHETNFYAGAVRKRNVTILPNDNGKFVPNFSLLISGPFASKPAAGSLMDRFTNDLGLIDLSIISLSNMANVDTIFNGITAEEGALIDSFVGATPEDPGIAPGAVLTLLQRLRDDSSNEVVFFDVSNLFYGDSIYPNSLVVTDEAITGTDGKVKITLCDNGYGSLYRCDASSRNPVWANVGDVLYHEGLITIKSPHIPFMGKDQFKIDLRGTRRVHIMRIHTLALPGEVNSSSNPSYVEVSSSLLAHETDTKFVYITGINYHDENINVIMKSKFAQPVIKKNGDRLMFRSKIDF